LKIFKKILIAEDELLIAKVMKMILEKNQFTVMHVVDSINAISVTKEFKPDVIILDIFLKNKSSGIDAAKQIRKNGFEEPIIFTTGNSFQETKEQIQGITNATLFIKPVDTGLLVKHLETLF
jgi:two-component system response regulator ArlR